MSYAKEEYGPNIREHLILLGGCMVSTCVAIREKIVLLMNSNFVTTNEIIK